MDISSVETLIRKYALVNAIEHEGVAQTKSVLGKIMAEKPELRPNILQVRSIIEAVVRDINKMSIAVQKKELEKLGGYTAPKRVERKGLPELELGREKFVVRFAPNPDGALHIGNARPAILSDEYAKKYHGKFILRFDDTDPKIKLPEKRFYSWIRDDLKWLKIRVNQEIIASKRLRYYYKIAEKLISINAAYVCVCNSESWKKLRDHSKACPCRSLDSKTNMKRWKKMLKHGYKEGQAVLRIKTEMDAKNPAVRDWPAFRIVDKPKHPVVKAKLWPLYNMASAVDDYLTGVTHIFRGQEHSTNEVKQRYLYQHLRWNYPIVVTLGRFSLSDMVLSKSQIREGIAKRKFRGWDDPRLGTLRALRRRGFQPDAIRQIIIDIGPKPSDITISFENLSAYNRKIIDRMANRYFFVQDPKKIEVKGLKLKSIRVPLHPDDKRRGHRTFSLTSTFFIDAKDFDAYKGLEVRLKDLCNIKLGEKSGYTTTPSKSTPKIQWVPAKHLNVKVIMPGREITGYGEMNLKKAKTGDIVQFERFAFVSIEKITGNNVTVIFAHE
jgi:glutamyl-tRNA synthetase